MSERLTVEQVSRDLVKRARDRAADPRKIWGIPWGFAGVDALTGGIHSEEMTVMMARPGVGKTQLMGQFALNVAEYLLTPEGKRLYPNQVVKLVLCEMSAASFQQRIVCYRAKVGQRKVREGTLSREGLARYEEAAESIAHLPIEYLDTPSSLEDTQQWVTTGKKTAWWAVDYIGIHPGGPKLDAQSQYIRVTALSKAFREVCKYHAPGLILSQMNRDIEKREDPRPRLSDLRDAGTVEQDAWNVMGLHRDDALSAISIEDQDREKPASLYIIKHRNGPLGIVELSWVPRSGAYMDVSKLEGDAL